MTGAPLHVLLVEDNPTNQLLGQRMLGGLGATVDTAANGLQAVRLAIEGHYDIIFMDCHMPEMDGLQATAAIRALEAAHSTEGGTRSRVPIVALTASALAAERADCIAAGMDDFIAKPFSRADIRAVIDRCCTRPSHDRSL